MKTDQLLLEAEGATVAFAFGRFNPAHQGHIEVWRAVEQAGKNWFIGTNPSTLGPNDPLTFQQKSAWMTEIYPPIAGHIVAEQSVLTLAAYIFKKLRKNEGATVAYITDADDWAWSGKLLNQYNGVEGSHGYYKFAQIIHEPSPRVSSATALRDAARADDKVAFYQASGTDPKSKVSGLTYFDTVKQAVEKYPLPVKKTKKVKEDDEQGEVEHGQGNQLIPWPAGTTKVHVSDVYDWYKLGQIISDLDDADPKMFGQGQPQTVIAFGSEEEESKLLPLLRRLGLKVDDIDPEGTDEIGEAYHAGAVYDYLNKANKMKTTKTTKEDVAEAHGNSKIYDKCWTGYKKVPGKKRGEEGSCEKIGEESALDEKSVSKAQFRTMAAVANNPEFAKKVGISPAVGKEFHSADKKTNYKKLPKKVDEILDPTSMSANVLRYLGRKTATAFPWIATGAVGGALAYSGLLAPIMASVGGVGTALAGLSTEVMAYGAVGGMAATPSLIQIVKDLFAADENSIQAGIKRWVEKHVGDENDVQEFINLHAQNAYLKQPMFRWRAEEWKTKMKPDEAEAYLEKHNKHWIDAEKQKVIDAEKAKADAAKPGMKPATESLDADQKRVGQVGGQEKAKKIGQVLAKPTKQHPYKGRLVGEADGFNGEYDDEAGMAKSNLLTTARAVAGLLKTIQDNDNLPEWGQEKIAKAEMMLVSIWDYLQSQKEQGIDPKVEGVTEAEIDFGPDWDEIVKRVGQRAKQGPLKTVWDEKKRVYRNVPVNDPDQPSKEVDEASLATMRDYFAGDLDAKDPTKLAQMRDFFNKNKPAGGKVQDKRFASRQAYELWLKQNGLRDLSSK